MKKQFPWKSLLWFIVPVLITALAVGVIVTPQTVPLVAWIIGGIALATAWGICGGVFIWQLKLWMDEPEPDHETKHHSILYVDEGLDSLDVLTDIERAVDHFVDHMVTYENVDLLSLVKLFKGLQIHVVDGPIEEYNRKFNGYTWPGIVKINWLEGCYKNAFFHECMHRVRQDIWDLDPDYKHEDAASWDIVASIKHSYQARVAQLAEHLFCNQGVGGSIPLAGSMPHKL